MSLTREIITLQFGNYANYVGTHWWNIQESGFNYDQSDEDVNEINHDIMFREGKDYKGGVTYTPRLILLDLKGVLKHHPEEGELYGHQLTNKSVVNKFTAEDVLWDPNNVEIVKDKEIEKPDYQMDLDDPVSEKEKNYEFNTSTSTWTDFIYSRYHPRSINLVREYEHSKVENAFDTFTNGDSIWKEYLENEIGNSVRQYIEECDYCQGFQTLFDCTDGFSGLTIKCLEHLQDEYSKVSFAIPLIPPKVLNFHKADNVMSDSIRMVNLAMTYANLIDKSSLFLPLSTMSKGWRNINTPREFSNIKYESDSFYQTSAIIASYLDTISLRYRVKCPTTSNFLPGFCSDLNNYNRKLAAGCLALPFRMGHAEDLIDCLDKAIVPLFTQLSPNSKIGTDRVVQSVSVRGIPTNRLKRLGRTSQHQMKMAAYRCESVSEMFQLYFQCNNYASLAHVSAIQTPMPIRTPFPTEIFNNIINFEGFLSDFEPKEKPNVSSVPMLAAVQVSNDLSNTLESLHREASRIKVVKLHRFKETGLEDDDYSEILNTLLEFKDNYDDNFEL